MDIQERTKVPPARREDAPRSLFRSRGCAGLRPARGRAGRRRASPDARCGRSYSHAVRPSSPLCPLMALGAGGLLRHRNAVVAPASVPALKSVGRPCARVHSSSSRAFLVRRVRRALPPSAHPPRGPAVHGGLRSPGVHTPRAISLSTSPIHIPESEHRCSVPGRPSAERRANVGRNPERRKNRAQRHPWHARGAGRPWPAFLCGARIAARAAQSYRASRPLRTPEPETKNRATQGKATRLPLFSQLHSTFVRNERLLTAVRLRLVDRTSFECTSRQTHHALTPSPSKLRTPTAQASRQPEPSSPIEYTHLSASFAHLLSIE